MFSDFLTIVLFLKKLIRHIFFNVLDFRTYKLFRHKMQQQKNIRLTTFLGKTCHIGKKIYVFDQKVSSSLNYDHHSNITKKEPFKKFLYTTLKEKMVPCTKNYNFSSFWEYLWKAEGHSISEHPGGIP